MQNPSAPLLDNASQPTGQPVVVGQQPQVIYAQQGQPPPVPMNQYQQSDQYVQQPVQYQQQPVQGQVTYQPQQPAQGQQPVQYQQQQPVQGQQGAQGGQTYQPSDTHLCEG
eukprot:UN03955